MKTFQIEDGTKVQTIIFDKEKFNTATAIKWLEDHGYGSSKVDETQDSFRFRQMEPDQFLEGSFKTIELIDGIKAVIGRPKEMIKDECPMGEHDDKNCPSKIIKEFNTMKGVEIFRAGIWNGDSYEKHDLDDMVNNFNKLKDKLRPRLKLGHNDEQKLLKEDGLPAAGYVTNLYVDKDVLKADFSNIPDKIFDLIKSKQFNDVSVEINWDLKDENTGEEFRRVLSAVALLGSEHPAVWDNSPLEMFLPHKSLNKNFETKHYKLTDYAKEKTMEMEKELEKLKSENESLKNEISKKEHERKLSDIDSIIEKYLSKGIIVPAQKESMKTILIALNGEDKKSYSWEGKDISGYEIFDHFLSYSKPAVDLKETTTGIKPARDKTEDNLLKARDYAKENKLSFEEALRIVGKL